MSISRTLGKHPDRNAVFAALYADGLTLQQIGDRFGVSRERVRQVLAKQGLTARDGGAAVQTAQRTQVALAARDVRYTVKWGHTYAAHRRLRLIGRGMMQRGAPRERTPIGAFIRQRHTAGKRGIGWSLTLAEWWTIWTASGKWCRRGRGASGYVMSRRGDVGPYAVDNVFIQRATQNSSDRPQKRSGLPTGVRHSTSGRYCASIARGGAPRYLGTYDTAAEASAAYRAADAARAEGVQ